LQGPPAEVLVDVLADVLKITMQGATVPLILTRANIPLHNPPSTMNLRVNGLTPCAVGAVGAVYRTSNGLILKFAHRTKEAWRLLRSEEEVYKILQGNTSVTVAQSYGLYENDLDLVLILSDAGLPINSFANLTLKSVFYSI